MGLRHIFAIALTTLVSGCFDLKHDIVVGDDGTTDVNVEIRVDAALINRARRNKAEPFCTDTKKQKMAFPFKRTYSKSSDGDDIVCNISFSGPTNEVLSYISKHAYINDSQKPSNLPYRINYSNDSKIKQLEVIIISEPYEEDGDPETQEFLKKTLAGRSLSWSVRAPQITRTNADLSEDGKTATFSVPLLFTVSGEKDPIRKTIEFRTE